MVTYPLNKQEKRGWLTASSSLCTIRPWSFLFGCRLSGSLVAIILKHFWRALGFFKRTLASQLGLRYMPDIKFYYDESFDYGSHIDKLLNHIKRNNPNIADIQRIKVGQKIIFPPLNDKRK